MIFVFYGNRAARISRSAVRQAARSCGLCASPCVIVQTHGKCPDFHARWCGPIYEGTLTNKGANLWSAPAGILPKKHTSPFHASRDDALFQLILKKSFLRMPRISRRYFAANTGNQTKRPFLYADILCLQERSCPRLYGVTILFPYCPPPCCTHG